MNELLQKHGCSNVFTFPEGLKELMADISREVLRDQPANIFDYISNYLSVLLITREHGILSVKILDDLCDCRPSVSEHLIQLGMEGGEASVLAKIIKDEIEELKPEEGKEKVRETLILKRILAKMPLDEELAAQVCQVARNAFRDYWYRKSLMEKNLNLDPHEAWEVAAERTLELYKRTKPSYSELIRASEKIQAAYRGYYVRRNLLRHLKPRSKKSKQPKVDLPGPPIDIAGSREINLGPVISVRVRQEDTTEEFDKVVGKSLNVDYHPMKTITHVEDDKEDKSRIQLGKSSIAATKSVTGPAKSTHKSAPAFKGIDQPDPMEEAPYKLPHVEGHASEAHILEADQTPSRAFVAASEQQLNKISFAEKRHEHVIDEGETEAEQKPAGTEQTEELEVEVPEEIRAPEPIQEDAPEVPEEIPGDATTDATDSAGEADSNPATSEPSAPTTDGDDVTPAATTDDEE